MQANIYVLITYRNLIIVIYSENITNLKLHPRFFFLSNRKLNIFIIIKPIHVQDSL